MTADLLEHDAFNPHSTHNGFQEAGLADAEPLGLHSPFIPRNPGESSNSQKTSGLLAGCDAFDLEFLKRGISVRNARFRLIIEELAVIAGGTGASILLMGPTGAGKSLLVRRLYELKRQKGLLPGAFVELNCASVQGALAQSMLFGHARGAFTGATCAREGLLRKADKGLLFLDEIGALGFEEQALLLKALEDRRFYPLGSDREVSSDFQLICGTNKDLYAEARAGRFRDDLLSRCNTWTFVLPGLKERPEDIEPNLDFELNLQAARTGKPLLMDREARRHFLDFAVSEAAEWLGNFRDFTASVQRMAAFAGEGKIRAEVVEREIERLKAQWRGQLTGYLTGYGERPEEAVADTEEFPNVSRILGPEAERHYDLFDLTQLELVLKVCLESRTLAEAGRILYAVSRNQRRTSNDSDRLRKYLSRFGLSWEDLTAPPRKNAGLLQTRLEQPDSKASCRLV